MNDWEEFPGSSRRLYSASEKKSLIRKLLASKESLTWSTLHDYPGIAEKIPSRRTLYRIFSDPEKVKIRDSTAQQIENLLWILQNHDAEVAPMMALTRTAGANLRQISGTTREASRNFLANHAGCFKCIRLTTRSRQILVTHLRVFEQAGGAVGFVHVEAIPDDASDLPSRPHRILNHRGFVLLKGRLAYFVSPYPALRQLTCVISTNHSHPIMSGVLLTQDAAWGMPFAARVLGIKAPDISATMLPESEEYGLFALDDETYSKYLPYIRNGTEPDSALFPTVEI